MEPTWPCDVTGDAQAVQRSLRPLVGLGTECIGGDGGHGLVQAAQCPEPAFVGRIRAREVVPAEMQTALDSLDQVGTACAHVEVRAGLHQCVPQRLASQARSG